jgi:hypothetical protein
MTPPPSLHELITTVQQDSPSDDPLDLLATASTTIATLSTMGDSVLDHFVAGARAGGRSWAEISGVLGVSKQAAHKRFAESASEPAPIFVGLDIREFSRFTDRARSVFAAAVEISKAMGHNYIGTEHLLLGQFREPEAVAAKILLGHGIDQAKVEARVRALVPVPGPQPAEPNAAPMPPLTPRAHRVLTGSMGEALKFGHNYIGTEHLLLGLYRQPDGIAAKVLVELGLTAEQADADVKQMLTAIRQERQGQNKDD